MKSKNFEADISIPAMDFLSAETLGKAEPAKKKPAAKPKKAEPAADRKQDTARKATEIKSRRVQLVLTPSMYEAVKAKSWDAHTSVNDYICRLIEQDLNGR